MNTLEYCSIVSPESKSETCGKFLIEDADIGYLLQDITNIGEEYTFSLWAKAEENAQIIVGDTAFDISPDWSKHTVTFIADSADFLIVFSSAGTYYIYHPQLETGNMPTDWSICPDDVDSRMSDIEATADKISLEVAEKVTQKDVDDAIGDIDEFHNAAVDITADGVLMKTTGSIRAVVDDVERLNIDEDGVSAPLIVADDIQSPTVVRKQTSATVAWKGGIQASLDVLPKYLGQDTTLTVPEGTYAENVSIRGYVGSRLNIVLSKGARINGTVTIAYCTDVTICASTLGDGAIYPSSPSDYAVGVYSTQNVTLENVDISGCRERTTAYDGTDMAIYSSASNLLVKGCCLEFTSSHVCYADGGNFMAVDCIGGCSGDVPTTNANLGHGFYAEHGAHGAVQGKVPVSVSESVSSATGTLLVSSIVPTVGGMDYEAPDSVTKSFSVSKHCTYLRNMRRIRDDQSTVIQQGKYGKDDLTRINWRTGALWFKDAATELAGKTISKATLSIRRGSSGFSNAVSVYLGAVGVREDEYDQTFDPAFTPMQPYPVGKLMREEDGVYDVTEIMSSIQTGCAIGVFEPITEYAGSFSQSYTTFHGKGSSYEPVLTVTYK